MSNIIKPFSEYPNTFAAIFKCHAVLTVTHEADENFRLYESARFYAIRLNNSAFDWKKHTIEVGDGYDFREDYNLPDFDEESEVEEWRRYNAAMASAIEGFRAFVKSISKEDWEIAAAAALESPDDEVPLRGFVPPAIQGFEISAAVMISGDDAYDILHYGEEEEDE